MIKKLLIACFVGICAFSLFGVSDASAYMMNWYINPSGTGFGSATKISLYAGTDGTAYIKNTFTDLLGNGTFQEVATFYSQNHDGLPTGYAGDNYLTATFSGNGNLYSGTSFAFTNGTLNIYGESKAGSNYASDTDSGTPDTLHYGANDGLLLGTFSLLNGGGALTANYAPNGEISANLGATFLKANTWFDPYGNDMSALTMPMTTFVLGTATTNATVLQPPMDTTLSDEYKEYFEAINGAGSYPGDFNAKGAYFYVSNGGQLRLDVVPEPTSMLLFGMGLLGIATTRLRKKKAA